MGRSSKQKKTRGGGSGSAPTRRAASNTPEDAVDVNNIVYVNGKAVLASYRLPDNLWLPPFDVAAELDKLATEAKVPLRDLSRSAATHNDSQPGAFQFYNTVTRMAHDNPDMVFAVVAVANDEYSNLETVCKWLDGLHCAMKLASIQEHPDGRPNRVGCRNSVLHAYIWRGEDYVSLADMRTASQLRQQVAALFGLADDECPICLESRNRPDANALPFFQCGHLCCYHCWEASLDACPVCRCTERTLSSHASAICIRANRANRDYTPEERRLVGELHCRDAMLVPLRDTPAFDRKIVAEQMLADLGRGTRNALPGELETCVSLLASLAADDSECLPLPLTMDNDSTPAAQESPA